ncbi:hypothetical protein [Thalassotalea fusca]
MKYFMTSAIAATILLMGCSSQSGTCEDVTLASEQIQACQALHKQIINAKDKPIIRTELERRYQNDCIDIRYYRDEHQAAICGNKEQIEANKKEIIKEIKG